MIRRKIQYAFLSAGCCLAAAASAELLIGWDGGNLSDSATNRIGITGNLWATKIFEVDTGVGSKDGSFGSAYSGASVAETAYEVRTVSPGSTDRIDVQIINGTGVRVQLDQLHFDYAAWWNSSPMDVQVLYAYGDLDITNGTAVATVSVSEPLNGNTGDYDDFDIALAGLTDRLLEDGQRATFRLVATNASGATSSGAFDNIAFSGTVILPADVTVSVNAAEEQHAVAKMSMGTGLVYSWYADSMFFDGKVAHIIKDIGLGSLRWPGGAVVTFYHWNDLNGQGWLDSWDPDYDSASNQPPEHFMDLDEYLALIVETGAEIMLGVNMSSGKEWNREADGLAEAASLMSYCQSRGYDVKYIFFDNESYHSGNNYNKDNDNDGEAWTPASYAESFTNYAAVVKAVYPEAKLIANWHNNVFTAGFENDVQTMFAIAGDVIDYLDIHFYWNWDNASWELWKSQLPMLHNSTGHTYTESVEYANSLFASLGYPQIRAVALEWNIGPGLWQTDPEHSSFRTALMQTEMQMQFLQSGLDAGSLFVLESPLIDPAYDKHVIRNGNPNATALWMWLFSKTGGKTVVASSSSAAGVYSLAAVGETGELVVYLLNKTDSNRLVELDFSDFSVNKIGEAWRFYADEADKGALQSISLWDVAGMPRTTLQADSLNAIVFNPAASAAPERPVIESASVTPVPDGLLIGWHSSAVYGGDTSVPGVTGTLGTGNLYELSETAGSTDSTFGTLAVEVTEATAAFSVRDTDGMNAVSFEIENRTGASLRLDAVHFDYSCWWTSSPKDVSLLYCFGNLTGITNQTVIQTVSGLPDSGKTGDYPDFDWPLTNLTDRVLDHGESATFKLVVSTAESATAAGAFDNIAVSGGTVSNAADSVLISWRAETGRKYTVLWTDNLVSNVWNAASSLWVGRPGDISMPVDFQSSGFYRLQVEP